MRILANQRGVDPGDPSYPYGIIVNGQTYLDQQILADVVYSALRLIDITGLTANGLAENNSNGYQILEAMKLYGRENTLTDRGDPSSFDYNQSTLTLDNTWRELDLSGIITGTGAADAKYVLIRIESSTNNIDAGDGIQFRMRKNGNANTINNSVHHNISQVQGTFLHFTDHWVAMNDRKIEYLGNTPNNGIAGMGLVVAGWQF